MTFVRRLTILVVRDFYAEEPARSSFPRMSARMSGTVGETACSARAQVRCEEVAEHLMGCEKRNPLTAWSWALFDVTSVQRVEPHD